MGVIKVQGPPVDTNLFQMAFGYISTIATGMAKTWQIFMKQITGREKTETLEWPEQPATYGDRVKGKHFLTRRSRFCSSLVIIRVCQRRQVFGAIAP